MGPVVSVLPGVENGCSPGVGLPAGRVFCWAPYHGVWGGGRLRFLFLCPKGLLKLKAISLPILAAAVRVKAAEMLGNLSPCRSQKSTRRSCRLPHSQPVDACSNLGVMRGFFRCS